MVHFFNREDEGAQAFVAMLISVALTLGLVMAIAMITYLIVFYALFYLLWIVGVNEVIAFTLAYAFGCGAMYAAVVGAAFTAGDWYLSIYMTLTQSVIPSVVETWNSWTSWIGNIAQSQIAAQRAKLGI